MQIVRLEFDHYDFKSRKTISSKNFALSLVASADINHINKFMDRVDEVDNDSYLRDIRITYEVTPLFCTCISLVAQLIIASFYF